jgi:hypothetical protein
MARALICPKGFSDDEADVWYAAQRQMRHQGTWSGKSDIPLLESYVRNVVLARQARQAINAYGDPFRAAGEIDRALIRGHLKVATDAEAAAHKLATALLLTAESRKRHGIHANGGGTENELSALVA